MKNPEVIRLCWNTSVLEIEDIEGDDNLSHHWIVWLPFCQNLKNLSINCEIKMAKWDDFSLFIETLREHPLQKMRCLKMEISGLFQVNSRDHKMKIWLDNM